MVHWTKPGAIKKWVLRYHIKASFKCASKVPTARKDRIFKILGAMSVGHPIARKERMKYVDGTDHEQRTARVCFDAAHAFAPIIEIALCKLVVITTVMPVQVQPISRRMALSSLPGPSEGQRETRTF